MPELRQNFLTKEWVIIATERAKRPEDMIVHRSANPVASFVETCPFCPGNESKTPPEVLRVPDGNGSWQVRVVPNRFAALARDIEPTRTIHRSLRTINGFGEVTESWEHKFAECPASRRSSGYHVFSHKFHANLNSYCLVTWRKRSKVLGEIMYAPGERLFDFGSFRYIHCHISYY